MMILIILIGSIVFATPINLISEETLMQKAPIFSKGKFGVSVGINTHYYPLLNYGLRYNIGLNYSQSIFFEYDGLHLRDFICEGEWLFSFIRLFSSGFSHKTDINMNRYAVGVQQLLNREYNESDHFIHQFQLLSFILLPETLVLYPFFHQSGYYEMYGFVTLSNTSFNRSDNMSLFGSNSERSFATNYLSISLGVRTYRHWLDPAFSFFGMQSKEVIERKIYNLVAIDYHFSDSKYQHYLKELSFRYAFEIYLD